MNYLDGRKAMLGDKVDLGGGMIGTVVCLFDDALYSSNFPASTWGQLQSGILVDCIQAGPIHFSSPSVDLVLIERGSEG